MDPICALVRADREDITAEKCHWPTPVTATARGTLVPRKTGFGGGALRGAVGRIPLYGNHGGKCSMLLDKAAGRHPFTRVRTQQHQLLSLVSADLVGVG
jgi:hypothetical protein